MDKIIGFTREGNPTYKIQQKNWLKRHRPTGRAKGKLEFQLPIDPAIAPTVDGAIVGGIFYYPKDVPEAVRKLKEDET